jgi:hypothetical protein
MHPRSIAGQNPSISQSNNGVVNSYFPSSCNVKAPRCTIRQTTACSLQMGGPRFTALAFCAVEFEGLCPRWAYGREPWLALCLRPLGQRVCSSKGVRLESHPSQSRVCQCPRAWD